MLEDQAGLLPGHAGEPREEFRELRAILEVLEERSYRHAGAAEYPGTTHPLGLSLHGGA